jgi:hypothetical protein
MSDKMGCFIIAQAFLVSALALAPVPDWPQTWDMSRSTMYMPCNGSGYTNPELMAKFGIVDFDWSNNKRDWASATPMDCEERLAIQSEMKIA